ncbi:MAG TPA: hypothetical protein PLC15_22530 [Candidatus Obscuribacter sp.]|nr:hypothetical protein [Candidatus Obscuribacter sp.]HND08218.1 hypothetical protein [Candidatus Obscuribacter sp.]
MTTPLASVGFKVFSTEEAMQLASVVAQRGERVGTALGSYMVLKTGTRSQLWAKLDEENRPYSICPHFEGDSRNAVLLAQRIKYNNKPLDGRYLAWMNPNGNTPGFGPPGEYTIIFECPNFAYYNFVEIPCNVTVQLAAAAREVSLYNSVEEYNYKQDKICPVGSVIGSAANAGATPAYLPEAYICGVVERTQVFENPFTHYYFQWALVTVGKVQFDVCIDAATLEVPMVAGGVVAGDFHLSGQLILDGA